MYRFLSVIGRPFFLVLSLLTLDATVAYAQRRPTENLYWPLRYGQRLEWSDGSQWPALNEGYVAFSKHPEGVGIFVPTVAGRYGVIADRAYIRDLAGVAYDPAQPRYNYSSVSQIIVVPDPASDTIVYAFFPPDRTGGASGVGEFTYSTLNVRTREIAVKDDVLLADLYKPLSEPQVPRTHGLTEQVAATYDAERNRYWIATIGRKLLWNDAVLEDSLIIFTFLLDAQGLHAPVVTYVRGNGRITGRMFWSVDGRRLLIDNVVYDMDLATGVPTFRQQIRPSERAHIQGGVLSPSGRFLYSITRYQVMPGLPDYYDVLRQTDIEAADTGLITAEWRLQLSAGVAVPGWYNSINIGPDCRLYLSLESHIGVVSNPDVEGLNADFQETRYTANSNAPDLALCVGFPDLINRLSFPLSGPSCLWPQVDFRGDTICEDSCLQLGAVFSNDVRSWEWTFAGGTPSSYEGQHPPCVRYEQAGTYVVRLVAGNPWGRDTVERTVVVLAAPVVDAGPDVGLCAGQAGRLAARGADRYRWWPEQGLDDVSSATPEVRLEAGVTERTYVVTGTTAGGCVGSDTVVVRSGALEAGISGDTTICRGSGTQLAASGGTSYRWWPEQGLSSATTSSPWATPQSTTTYHVEVRSGTCVDTATVTVGVAEGPVVVAGGDTTICRGSTVVLTSAVSPASMLLWYDAQGVELGRSPAAATGLSVEVQPTSDSRYQVVAVTAEGCRDTSWTWVGLEEAPSVDAGAPVTVCAGQAVELEARAGRPCALRWYDEQGQELARTTAASTSLSVTVSPSVRTVYTVEARSAAGCVSSSSVVVEIGGSVAVTSGDTTICAGQEVWLEARLGGGQTLPEDTAQASVIWSVGGRPVGSGWRVAVRPSTTTVYDVVVDVQGCRGQSRSTVTVEPSSSVDVRVGSGRGMPGTTVTTSLTVTTAGAVAGDLTIGFGATLPVARLRGVDVGTVDVVGATVTVPGAGTYQLTWDLLLSGQLRTRLDAQVAEAEVACRRVTVAGGDLELDGCAIARRAIVGLMPVRAVVTSGGRRLRVALEPAGDAGAADGSVSGGASAVSYTATLWTLTGERVWSQALVAGETTTTDELSAGLHVLRLSLPWGTAEDILTMVE